jgi:MraZ protein
MDNAKHTFAGNFQVSIDSKQRLAIPKTMRETLAKSYGSEADIVMVTLAMNEPSLAVYPLSVYNNMMDRLEASTELNTDTQAIMMLLSATARECQIDGQGRIRLPEDLMAHAGLEKDVYICGHVSRMQIWQPERWKEFFSKTLMALPQVKMRAFKSNRKP